MQRVAAHISIPLILFLYLNLFYGKTEKNPKTYTREPRVCCSALQCVAVRCSVQCAHPDVHYAPDRDRERVRDRKTQQERERAREREREQS